MKRRLYFCDHHRFALPAGHRFPAGKYELLRKVLANEGRYELVTSPAATVEDLCRVHDRTYVEQFLGGTLPAQAMRRIGFPWSEQLVQRSLASVGGTLMATAEALATGMGGNLGGGTHHAFRAEGAGYCVWNDIAVAIHWMRERSKDIPNREAVVNCDDRHGQVLNRVAVVDCDVHQGDGTAAIFADDPQVFTLSLHGRKNFPFRKQRSRLDVELDDGTGDNEYLEALEKALAKVFDFAPELIFYQSGVDALGCDLLGRLSLTHEGLAQRDQMVLESCRRAGVPVVITLGGGYGNPVEATVLAHANTYRTALTIFGGEVPSAAAS